ncbi:MAG: 16S rRNA (guanine(527)-N(7))-methyltransferase RsmG [Pseudomonadota bacterium]
MQRPEWFERDVSRETLDALAEYANLLARWTVKINLIAKSTIDDIAHRHIWDSAQVYTDGGDSWTDLGSGGGLPGVVMAILAKGEGRALQMALVESDQRKATFLRTCSRTLDLPITVLPQRVEDIAPQASDTISARALADLNQLLHLATPHMAPAGRCIFMKGAQWQEEVAAAQANWRFSYEAKPSMTHPQAAILTIGDIKRV